MALITKPYSADPTAFNLRAVEAGDADEMLARLAAEVSAALTAGEFELTEFVLGGTGAGPNWQAWFVTGGGGPDAVALSDLLFAVEVASNPAEARLRVMQKLAALSPTPDEVIKVVVAGGGIGTIFMAIAVAVHGGC
jgi:hypothetical protein